MEKLRRCRALHNIVGHQGVIKAQTKGTVEAEMENLGRHLIKVQWDSHIAMYGFPEEIELIDPVERCALEVVLTESPKHLRRKFDAESGLAVIDLR